MFISYNNTINLCQFIDCAKDTLQNEQIVFMVSNAIGDFSKEIFAYWNLMICGWQTLVWNVRCIKLLTGHLLELKGKKMICLLENV